MQNILRSVLYYLRLLLVSIGPVLAQNPSQPNQLLCGIEELTPAQALSLTKEANLALQRKRASGAAFTAITYVPIRPHIVRRSDGSGGFNLARLNQVMAVTNSYYLLNGFGIQFYFAGDTPDYINDDYLYTNGTIYPDGNAANALNQYYLPFIDSGAGGYAYYPDDYLITTRSVIAIGGSDEDLGNRLIPHELGHNFNLIHTFGQNGGSGVLGSGTTTELVTRGAGANCATDGDLVCDTPADPYNMPGANLIYPNGCPQYDPSSTARDAHGDAYTPSITNIMSYYFPCTHDFTPGQYDRMQAGLALRQTHTSYTLDAPPTAVTTPSNLTGSLGLNSVILTWQDNANNEMGYFIERSTSPTSGFVQIGGVAPDVTTFTDTKIIALTQYYYRIRPSNTTTGSLSGNFTILIDGGQHTTNITGNSAQLNWNPLGINITYDLQWRTLGSSVWTTYSQLSSTSYSLYSLTTNTAYEWQIKASNSNTYYPPVSFTTTCPTPYLSVSPALTSASLYWSSSNGQTYTLQWRSQGSSPWNTINDLTGSYYTLSSLASSTAYEVRMQGICSTPPQVTTDFSSIQSFTTLSCSLPYGMYTTDVYANSARLYWYAPFYDPSLRYEIRYQPVGTSDWTTISNLPLVTNGFVLTGLTNNTQYEWQIKSVCPNTESSKYSTSYLFTTICRTPTSLVSTVTATGAQLYWLSNTIGATSTYEIQYRVSGATDWITINGIPGNTSTGSYSLTGLSTNVPYEWRIRTICSVTDQSDYSPTNTFTPTCYAPSVYSAYASLVSSSAAQFNWSAQVDPGTSFDLRYRPVGAPDWTAISGLTANVYGTGAYNLTGLTNNTQYEWQIRSVCSGTESSTFTPGATFTTQCQSPYPYSSPQVTSATVSWYQMGIDVTYEVRYRQSGTSGWTTVSSSTTIVIVSGLVSNTQYELQVRTLCTNGVYSDFSASTYFTTASCYTPSSIYTTNHQATSVRLNWYFYAADANTRYEARYRIVGTTNWTILSDLSSTNSVGYIDLTNLTTDSQYEWQIRTICSTTESSAFSSSILFSLCSVMYTTRAGFWTDASIWTCNRVPTSSDVVLLKHAVTLPTSAVGFAKKIGLDPGITINYGTNAQLKVGQ